MEQSYKQQHGEKVELKLNQLWFEIVCNNIEMFIQLMGSAILSFYILALCKDLLCNIWKPTEASVDKNHAIVLKSSLVLDSCNTRVLVSPVPMSVIPSPSATRE